MLEHFKNPRNVGTLDPNDPHVGTGLAGNPARSGVIRLQIWVNDQQLIEQVRFKAYGCGYTIACGSLLSEWLDNRTLEQALTLSHTRIAERLALPPEKLHCSVLAEDALQAALAEVQTKRAGKKTTI